MKAALLTLAYILLLVGCERFSKPQAHADKMPLPEMPLPKNVHVFAQEGKWWERTSFHDVKR